MLSGRRLDLLDPSPLDIEIEDIAHGLARVARWNGQTSGDYTFSVAEHSLLVEEIAGDIDGSLSREYRLAALLHDAPEYVIGDLISPFKAALSLDYHAFEARLLGAIHVQSRRLFRSHRPCRVLPRRGQAVLWGAEGPQSQTCDLADPVKPTSRGRRAGKVLETVS
jgi:hypothetical protein